MIADLLRHGQTGLSGFRGRLDDPLTPAGWDEMQQAVASADTRWKAVISSPLKRCADFARQFAHERGLPLNYDTRLTELDFGDWEGVNAEQLMASDPLALKRFWSEPQIFTPPNGESFAAFENRVRTAWQDNSSQYHGESVLLITHGGVIRLLLCLLRKLPYSEFLNLAVPHASLHRVTSKPRP